MDESRKAFEQWYLLNWGHTEDNLETLFETGPDDDSYYRLGVRLAYEAWTASRSAIALDMPEPFKLSKSSSGLTYYYQDEVDAVLSVAGIKVKE